jgi:membrane protein implicated in regulation of membrane protease activity
MPLTLYLIALFVGGPLVLFSALGADADADVDLDVDADVDLDADADAELDADGGGLDGWLPFARVRFWVFLLFMVGLLGTALTLAGELGAGLVAALALGVGTPAAMLGERAIRALRSSSASAAASSDDFIGAQGVVLLPVGSERAGQIRVRVRGREIDLEARLDEGTAPLAAREPVLVYELTADGVALVQPLPRG